MLVRRYKPRCAVTEALIPRPRRNGGPHPSAEPALRSCASGYQGVSPSGATTTTPRRMWSASRVRTRRHLVKIQEWSPLEPSPDQSSVTLCRPMDSRLGDRGNVGERAEL